MPPNTAATKKSSTVPSAIVAEATENILPDSTAASSAAAPLPSNIQEIPRGSNAQPTMYCPKCRRAVVPNILLTRNPMKNIVALVLCLLCLWPCALCVFCCPCGITADYFCPNCGAHIIRETLS